MTKPLTALFAALLLTTCVSAQRFFIGPTPTNLRLDLSNATVLADGTTPGAFFLITPLNNVQYWARFDAGLSMDTGFGAGNWLRCRMDATEWAYLSSDACANLPAAGTNAPLSLLTTSFDFGPYAGQSGIVNSPIPGVTRFPTAPSSYVEGLGNTWIEERWQLRTRGFWQTEAWNGCTVSSSVDPNFAGFLVARFTVTFS